MVLLTVTRFQEFAAVKLSEYPKTWDKTIDPPEGIWLHIASLNFKNELNITLPWWRHQMETFPRYWPYVRGIHRSPVNSPDKGQLRGAFVFSLICAWINGWDKREAGDLRRQHAHYGVTVMMATCTRVYHLVSLHPVACDKIIHRRICAPVHRYFRLVCFGCIHEFIKFQGLMTYWCNV